MATIATLSEGSMQMALEKLSPKSRVEDGNNPYMRALRVWTDRYGALSLQVRNWQIVAASASALCLLLGAGLVAMAMQQKVVPYLVEVDKAGSAVALGPAVRAPLESEAIYRSQIAAFIRMAKSVSIDPSAMKANFSHLYKGYARDSALAFLDSYYKENDPFEESRERTVSVEPVSILRVADNTWQVRWREVGRALDGYVLYRANWEAQIVTKIDPPSAEKDIILNPTGLRVVELAWTKSI